MKSLRLRLLYLLERHFERRTVYEAETHLRQLVAGLSFDTMLKLEKSLSDPLYLTPYSGHYYQVNHSDIVLLRSRSLWDMELNLPKERGEGVQLDLVQGPKAASLLLVSRIIILNEVSYRAGIGMDRAEIIKARNAFAGDLVIALICLSIVLMAAFYAQVSLGLIPLKNVRSAISRIKSGGELRLSNAFPSEILPLTDAVNGLLDQRDTMLIKARGRAADLAHGLKTPLTALEGDIRRLRALGQGEIADEISSLGLMMQRHVTRELGRTRVVGHALVPVCFNAVALSIIAVIKRTPKGEGLNYVMTDEALSQFSQNDLEEILGNLLENAVRYAKTTIYIRCDELGFTIEDDGEEVNDDLLASLIIRGVRLDIKSTSTGLGIAIVQDILEAYGAYMTFSRTIHGGLAVQVIYNVALQNNFD
jgi:signal transduction histidine kinase